MADSQKYEVYGNPTLRQGGWTRTSDNNDYVDYMPEYVGTYYYRICTLEYVPQHHPNQITITGIASKELEVSVLVLRSDNYIISAFSWQENGYTFNLGSTYDKLGVMFRFKNGDTITPNEVTFDEVGAWVHSLRKLTTATEAVESPLYSDGTAITSYTIKGNTIQSGTPSPSSPIPVNGVGELETTGEHSGEYKIPISSGGVTTNIYLGSTVSNRWIQKVVLTGQEAITTAGTNYSVPISPYIIDRNDLLCSHFFVGAYSGPLIKGQIRGSGSSSNSILFNYDNGSGGVDSFKNWLLQQYNNNTPVVIFYVRVNQAPVLNNEPLMKIGTYADTLSNAVQIPTTEGANSITVDTTVQPSEFTATWTGWHNANVKEWDGSQWIE